MAEWLYPLRRGNSPDPKQGACLMDAVSWAVYGHLGDHPDCVDLPLTTYGIGLDDWLDYADRQKLKPLIPLLPDTKRDQALSDARMVLIYEGAMAIARNAGLRTTRQRAVLSPIQAYTLALQQCLWSQRHAVLIDPAIALLRRAIELQGSAEPIAAERIAEANRSFALARAA